MMPGATWPLNRLAGWCRWLLSGASVLAIVTAQASAGEYSRFGSRLTGAASAAALLAAQNGQANATAAAQAAQQSLLAARAAAQSAVQAQNIARATFTPRLTNPKSQGLLTAPPDGITVNTQTGIGGLELNPNVAPQNGKAPKVDPNNSAIINIEQTAAKAIYDWTYFNVGSNTTVNFQQQSSDWSVLNRIGNHSQILGNIQARGNVLLINQNGILFGPNSQINVHSLIASSLDVGDVGMTKQARDLFFLNTGIASGQTVGARLANSFSKLDPATLAGDVVVQKGAFVTTTIENPDAPGFVYLFGSNVTNQGTLYSPRGEVALVSAEAIALRPGKYDRRFDIASNAASDPELDKNGAFDIRGTSFAITAGPNSRYRAETGPGLNDGTGRVVNEGIISTPGGITILNGDKITMSGVISADTTISRNSRVFIDAVTSVEFSGTISVLPVDTGENLPFAQPEIQISGHRVTLEPTALISAPGAKVSVDATSSSDGNFRLNSINTEPAQVRLKSGATIDVAGLQNVVLPVSYNIISFEPRGLEFADQPLQRDGPLFGATIYIDIRDTGTRSDGTAWVGTPLADASGFAALVPTNINQRLTVGGTVSLKTDLTFANQGRVVVDRGAVINVAGGTVNYQGGKISTTKLLAGNGLVYDISKADPELTYVGIAGGFIVPHARWNAPDVFVSMGTRGHYEPGYTEGSNAGSISIQSFAAPLLDGSFLFGAQAGVRQIVGGKLPDQGSFSLTTPNSVVITDGAEFTHQSANLTVPGAAPLVLSAQQYTQYNLSNFSIAANDLFVPSTDVLTLAPGGKFNALTGGAIDIQGSIVAHGGQINLIADANRLVFRAPAASVSRTTDQADIVISGTLDVTGRWVNDFGVPLEFLFGPAFINGGSITLRTVNAAEQIEGGGTVARTGNITLATGSLLDASSGGYIDPQGAIKTQSAFVAAGKGGDITLETFTGKEFKTLPTDQGPEPPDLNHDATVQLAGTLRSFGFSGGGTLTIVNPEIQIGGEQSSDPITRRNTLYLDPSFFNNGGFGSYVLKSPATNIGPFARGIRVAANTQIVPLQQNFSNLASYKAIGTGEYISRLAPIVTLPADLRKPVNLTLSSPEILLGDNSSIVTDPATTINILGIGNQSAVALRGSITDHGGSLFIQGAYIWLGPQAHLDFSGTFVDNSHFLNSTVSQSGTLLSGGSVFFDTTVAGEDSTGVRGFVIAEAGASIDVSGAAAVITGRFGPRNRVDVGTFVDVPSWSDGGTIGFNTKTFLWDGTLKADAGAPQGNRGTLMLGGNAVALQQNNQRGFLPYSISDGLTALKNGFGLSTPAELSANGAFITTNAPIIAAADKLAAFDTVFLYAGSYDDDAATFADGLRFFFAAAPMPSGTFVAADAPRRALLTTYGDVSLNISNRLYVEAGGIQTAPGTTPSVAFSSPYVMFAGGYVLNVAGEVVLPFGGLPTSSALARDFTVTASTIDVQTMLFSGFSRVNFNAAGDIRLMAPPVSNGEIAQTDSLNVNANTFFGALLSGGDISLTAQRIYPVSAVDFQILSTAQNGKVTFNAPTGTGVPEVPYSAGGTLRVSADTIVQGGNLFAPLGQIFLGAETVDDLSPNDKAKNIAGYLVPTRTLTLNAGSVTSVSLHSLSDDTSLTVPYGQTEDGVNWFYNANTSPLSGPPSKSLRLIGASTSTSSDAVVDLRGGGDLLAFEYVKGRGGSRDVLSSLISTGEKSRPDISTAAVYAILPSAPGKPQDLVGAYDIHFNSFLGDPSPRAGQQIYLDGGNGIAAGWYTLYPAHYATLPNALRVVDYGNSLAKPNVAGTTRPDGTQIVSGQYGQSDLGKRSSGTSLFAVQPRAVWSRYTEVVPSTANAYFSDAVRRYAVTPPLPIDAGRLGIFGFGSAQSGNALSSISFDSFRVAPAPGGRGSQLDLSAPKVGVVGIGVVAPPGFVAFDVSDLNNSNFESILIGGRRTDQADGTLISPLASEVIVDTGGTTFAAPEIILVARPDTQQTVIPITGTGAIPGTSIVVETLVENTGTVTVRQNSVIRTSGNVSGPGRNYLLGQSLASFLGGTLDSTTGSINGVVLTTVGGVRTPPASLVNYADSIGVGALLLVSNDPTVTLESRNTATTSTTINFIVKGTNAAGGSVTLPGATQDGGRLVIEAGATIGNGVSGSASEETASIIVSASAKSEGIRIDTGTGGAVPSASLRARSLTVAAKSFGIGDNIAANNAANTSFIISRTLADQLTSVKNLTLKSLGGSIDFYGISPIDFGAGKTLESLTLDTPALVGHGLDVTLRSSGTITLVNNLGAAVPSGVVSVGATLLLDAGDINSGKGVIAFGGGNMNIDGFGAAVFAAGDRVEFNGAGNAAVNTPIGVTVLTPNVVVNAGTAGTVGTGNKFTLTTPGTFLLANLQARRDLPTTVQTGGSLEIEASSIELFRSNMLAQSGSITLHATGSAGDVFVNDFGRISAPGYWIATYDQIRYSPGGAVSLIADHGNVRLVSTAIIDVSQPVDLDGRLGGAGGEVNLVAPEGAVLISEPNAPNDDGSLKRAISGLGAPGLGGIFRLDAQRIFRLDSNGNLVGGSLDILENILSGGGFTGEIDIHTRVGSIDLASDRALTAHRIALTADDPNGRISVAQGAVMDASGATAGTIELYARRVDIDGRLDAYATGPDQSGGKITIGTTGTNSGAVDPTYGYEVLTNVGLLNIGSNAIFRLSGTRQIASNPLQTDDGTLILRAPVVGGGVSVNFGIANARQQLVGVKNVILEGYAIWSTTDSSAGDKHFDGIIDPGGTTGGIAGVNRQNFYQITLAGFVQNGLQILPGAIEGLFANNPLPDGTTFRVRPGIELRNPDPTINNGNITVASSWNLAAGKMVNATTNVALPVNSVFNPAQDAIQFIYRFGIEPGALTLRARNDIEINASISDGFYHYQNLLNATYLSGIASNATPWKPLPAAPIPTPSSNVRGDNTASPGEATFDTSLQSYDVFPSRLNVVVTESDGTLTVKSATAVDSWSYTLTAGADFSSANPNATVAIGERGDVIVDGHKAYAVGLLPVQYTAANGVWVNQITVPVGLFGTERIANINLPTMVRTGTGDITINASRDIVLRDRSAPGVIYAAGRNTELLPDPVFTGTTPLNLVAGNPAGFVEPNMLTFANGTTLGVAGELGALVGPPTAAAFPEQGGDIVMRARRNIVGWQNVVAKTTTGRDVPHYQFYAPWLLARTGGTGGSGAFTPGATYQQQTAWWIQFGRFDQGVLSVGGNVTVVAGNDIRDLSVSLPTTGRVSGGLTAPNMPVTHLYGSGNLSMRSGGDLFSGAIYEGSGIANVSIGGSVRSDWNGTIPDSVPGQGTAATVPVSTVLAVDTGQINLMARGSILITNVINPAEIQVMPQLQPGGARTHPIMTTYGPDSAIRLTSIGGNVTIDSQPNLLSNCSVSCTRFFSQSVTQTYPSIVEVNALGGNITTPFSGMVLTDSPRSTLNLFALVDVDLRGGVTPSAQLNAQLKSESRASGSLSLGSALINLQFSPYAPNMDRNEAVSTPRIAHENDPLNDIANHIYAVYGDIKGFGTVASPRPVDIRAGHDIVDLNVIVQNIRSLDVSEIVAGNDLFYTGYAIGGGLQVAGPGFLNVMAGRDLGPFLPTAADTSTNVKVQQGITSVGNAATFTSQGMTGETLEFPVGSVFVDRNGAITAYPIGLIDTALVGLSSNQRLISGRRAYLFPNDDGASLNVKFGVGPGIDYQGFYAGYLDPNRTVNLGHDYRVDFKQFLNSLGFEFKKPDEDTWEALPSLPLQLALISLGFEFKTPADAWAVLPFLPLPLQNVFTDKVFFAELATASLQKALPGYAAIEAMFPAAYGYSQNNLDGGRNGAPSRVKTGNLDLLHATVQTRQGGNIWFMGPGGDIRVGSLAPEPNPNLKLNNIGILSLANGEIRSMTDGSVIVNSSRVITEFGGDIFAWSSNGDLDAGRGSRTVFSNNPLRVNFDNNDYQTIDLSGFVSGAGFATLQTSPDVPAGNVTLLAPNGKVDAGDAGIRVSGNLVIGALTVLNADNIKVGGSSAGVPTAAPSSAGAISAPPTTPPPTNTTVDTTPTGTAGSSQPSIVIVEITGYGGGDGEEKAEQKPDEKRDSPQDQQPESRQ